tara:strand:- start:413 stop:1192 length:780 start_codon:yes stop_codon:yes gene_type:complete
MIANLIGQSRIENGVHFPSDVSAGKLLGQILADIFLNERNVEKEKIESKSLSKHLRKKATEFYKEDSKKDAYKNYMYDIADFLKLTNQIEGIRLDEKDCMSAAKSLLQGYSMDFITNNIHLASTINAIKDSFKYKDINNFYKICEIHKSLKKDTIDCEPGEIRTFKKNNSILGNAYAYPENIFKFTNNLSDFKNPYVRHVIFEWVHPFTDGNGRLGRIILLHDVDFNFSKVNSFCNKNYTDTIQKFILHHKSLNNVFNI